LTGPGVGLTIGARLDRFETVGKVDAGTLLRAVAAGVALTISAGCTERSSTAGSASPSVTNRLSPTLAICADAGTQPPDTLTVYFHCTDDPPRTVRGVGRGPRGQAGASGIEAALEALVAGPTAKEVEAGFFSWFSSATRDAVLGADVTDQGFVTVNLDDISHLIPNASTSAGGAVLLDQLSSTVLQFDEVTGVTYQFNGSCDAFWNWLQSDCQSITRAMWESQVDLGA
jgi:spore germination protein GerM